MICKIFHHTCEVFSSLLPVYNMFYKYKRLDTLSNMCYKIFLEDDYRNKFDQKNLYRMFGNASKLVKYHIPGFEGI